LHHGRLGGERAEVCEIIIPQIDGALLAGVRADDEG
jgi:hypothetical protein